LMGTEGVGKSTVANHLVAEPGFVELSFATALRESAVAMWNGIASMCTDLPTMTIDDTQDRAKKEAPIGDLVLAGRPFSPRVLLQWFGTDIMRNMVADDIWAHATISKLRKEIEEGKTRFVFSDYRFPNEYESVKAFLEQNGFSVPLTVRLVPGNITTEELSRVKEAALHGHPSARGWVTLPAHIEIANPLVQETMNAWLTDVCQMIINRV
jgi:hypothetical protein